MQRGRKKEKKFWKLLTPLSANGLLTKVQCRDVTHWQYNNSAVQDLLNLLK